MALGVFDLVSPPALNTFRNCKLSFIVANTEIQGAIPEVNNKKRKKKLIHMCKHVNQAIQISRLLDYYYSWGYSWIVMTNQGLPRKR